MNADPTPQPDGPEDPYRALRENARRAGEASPIGRELASDQFDWKTATGGVRGAIEGSAPGIVFVVAWLVTHGSLTWPLICAATVGVAAAVVRLVRREPVMQAVTGLIGVAICVVLAKLTGRAENYLLPAILVNVAYLVACLVSLACRWPVVGLFISVIRMDPESLKFDTSWRRDPVLNRRCTIGTWLLVAMFALRVAVKLPLYLAGEVAWLGIVHIAMGFPLYAVTLWGVWLLLRGHVRPPRVEAPPNP